MDHHNVVALPKTIILFGPPGSGKDTQAFALAKRFGYFVLATGDLFRAEVARETPAGKHIQRIMEKGELVSADLVREIVAAELERHRSTIAAVGLIFDGFPRMKEEIGDAEELIDRFNLRPDLAILLDVAKENLLARLLARGRQDDTPNLARERIGVYERETSPIIDYYRSKNKLLVIDGNPSIEKVTQNIFSALGSSDDPLEKSDVPWGQSGSSQSGP